MSTGAATECRVERGRAMWSSSDEGVYAFERSKAIARAETSKNQKKKQKSKRQPGCAPTRTRATEFPCKQTHWIVIER